MLHLQVAEAQPFPQHQLAASSAAPLRELAAGVDGASR
jgi:hypothetical protein